MVPATTTSQISCSQVICSPTVWGPCGLVNRNGTWMDRAVHENTHPLPESLYPQELGGNTGNMQSKDFPWLLGRRAINIPYLRTFKDWKYDVKFQPLLCSFICLVACSVQNIVCFTFTSCSGLAQDSSKSTASTSSPDPPPNVGTQSNMEQIYQHPLTSTDKSWSRNSLPTDRVPENVEQDNGRQYTLVEKSTPSDQANVPPNGGLLAWLQVAASFCIFFSTWYVRHLP